MVAIIVTVLNSRVIQYGGEVTGPVQSTASGLYVLCMRIPDTLTVIVEISFTTDLGIKFQFEILSFMYVTDTYLRS